MSETNAQSVSELVGEGKRAKLVMGEPLGGEAPMEGDSFKPEDNEEILVDLPDSATELELTHLRLRTLRGLQLQRFTQVIRISLRQNLLSSLSYTPNPPSNPESETLPTISSESAQATAADAPSTAEGADDIDEDDNDDEDAKKKEQEFEYHESHSEARTQENGETAGEVQWPLRNLEELEEIDLYDNRLKSVKGLEGLTALKSLDLSFNLLRHISQLNDPSPNSPFAYPELDHLYLIQNKLSKIEGVQHRTGLVYLEFGGNRIRTIEALPISSNLRSLFLGKNKITKIEGLDGLVGLTTLSIQSNRITKMEGLESLINLEELYLSHNGLTKVEGLLSNLKLTTLDVGNNKIDSVPAASLLPLTLLEEFWANDNLITALPSLPPTSHPNLTTIYLEGNPVMKDMGTAYKRKVMLEMPQVKQIDATFVRQS